MKRLFSTAKLVQKVQGVLQTSKPSSRTELFLRAVSGDLQGSASIDGMLSKITKSDSDVFAQVLSALKDSSDGIIDVEQYQTTLESLLSTHNDSKLRSKHDTQNSTLSTTTITKSRVNLTKVQKQVSAQDVEYTALLEGFVAELETFLAAALINPQDLLLHEVFVFDMRNPLKDSFAPRARFSIERALSNPFDYLSSSSSSIAAAENNLSAKQPETAILYQLYLESGALVNIFDLWKAFSTIVSGGDDDGDGDAGDERTSLMLFYRALSELKALGMMKPSRKKIDHVSKSSWRGL